MDKDFGKEAPFQQPTSQLNRIEGMLSCVLEWVQSVRLGVPPPTSGSRAAPVPSEADRPSGAATPGHANPSADWVPKKGEWCIVIGRCQHMIGDMVVVSAVLDGVVFSKRARFWDSDPEGKSYASDLRPATPSEVQQWEAEQEAKKPLVFGADVEYEAGGRTWKARYIGVDKQSTVPPFTWHCLWTGTRMVTIERSKFKVLEG